jgi:Sec-independent protein translocase protein TatA
LVFNVSGGELFLIVVLFVLLFGPERVPEVAAQLGKALRQIRELTDASTAELRRELELAARELEQGTKANDGDPPPRASADADAPAPGQAGSIATRRQPVWPPSVGPAPDPALQPAPASSIFRRPAEPDEQAPTGDGGRS